MAERLFISMKGLHAALLPRALARPEFPGIPSCLSLDTSIQLWGPCPFKTFKKHSLFFVPGAPAAETHSQVLLSCFPGFQHPTHALCLHSDADGWGWVFSSPGLPLPPCSDSSPPAGS